MWIDVIFTWSNSEKKEEISFEESALFDMKSSEKKILPNFTSTIKSCLTNIQVKLNLLVNNNSYSSLEHYKYEKKHFFENVFDNFIEDKKLLFFLEEYKNNFSSFEQYGDDNNLKNNFDNNIEDRFLKDFLFFLENNSSLVDINKLIYIILNKRSNKLNTKLLKLMKEENTFFSKFFNLEEEKKDDKFLLNLLDENNTYNIWKWIAILYENNQFYLKVTLTEQVFWEWDDLIKDSLLSDEEWIYDKNNTELWTIRKITNLDLLESIVYSREKIKENWIEYDCLINPHLPNRYRLKKQPSNTNNAHIYPVDKYTNNLLGVDGIKKWKEFEFNNMTIEEVNYFNYEIDKFLKWEFLSNSDKNFRKLFLSNKFNQSISWYKINFLKNYNLREEYIKKFCISLYIKIWEEKRNNFIEKLNLKKIKNEIEKLILNFLNSNNVTKIVKDNNFTFQPEKFAKHCIEEFGVNEMMKDDLYSAEKHIKYEIIPNDKNYIIDELTLLNDLYNLYLINYPDQKEFTDQVKKDLFKMITQKKFINIYFFETRLVPLISLYIQKVNDDTVYIWWLASNNFLKAWFDFAKDRVEKEWKTKNIEIIVYTEIWEKKNRYKWLIWTYKKMWFELTDWLNEIEKKDDNKKVIAKYIEMRRPKDKIKSLKDSSEKVLI